MIQATKRLVDQFQPLKVILFGSQARGTANEQSDVDFLVICRVTGKKRLLATAMDRALRGFGFARDIIIMTPEEFERDRHIPGTIAKPASQEGMVLYDIADS